MKNIHYYFIIAILSLIIGLLNIDIQSSKDIYDVRLDEGYISSLKTLSSNTSIGNNSPMNSFFPTNTKPVGTPINVHPVLKQDEYMSAAFEYSLGDARLIGEAGCMREDVALSINPIENNQLPPLNQGMVNVTGDNTGYRMLPKGMVFKNDIDIILPYDTTLLPIGFTPNDIKTYYYDERFKRWIEIERDSVDETNQLVISKVNHFTDFINAILKTPEMPETSAYAPTQMNDIKAANPLEGMTLMQPPTANNSGTVSMSYTIEIPAGRQGMQPNLALNYNGGTSSSWVGVGWDLSMPTISVETRWGVPRYNDTLESELYLLNGLQLVSKDQYGILEDMPHRTNDWKNRNTNPVYKQFYPRINETFDSIVRHGTDPTNYWWSVTDRNGITSYYGKMHDSDNLNPNAVLTDDNDNIAQWCLTETRDINGNTVRYFYSIIYKSGIVNSSQLGKNIYIDSINYTGFVNLSNIYERGKYTVCFQRSFLTNSDPVISCNYGFKQVIDDKLCQIYYSVQDQPINGIRLKYENNANSLYKSRLTDIIKFTGYTICLCNLQFDADTSGLSRTHFEYENAPTKIFGEAETIGCHDDDVKTFFLNDPLNITGYTKASALGATKGKSWSVGGTGTIGIGPDISTTLLSVGGNFDYSQSSSEGLLTMIDLNGDGLSDKVYKKDDKIWYRPMIMGSHDEQLLGDEVELKGLKNILKESSESTSWGLQASALVVSANGSWSSSTSFTNVYFSDVNADGLPDLITDDGVLFNKLENGNPTFSDLIQENLDDSDTTNDNIIQTYTSGECGGIIFDGTVDPDVACHIELEYDTTISPALINWFIGQHIQSPLTGDDFQFFIDDDGKLCDVFLKKVVCESVIKNPDLDLVKVWVALRDGTISVHSFLQMLNESYEPNMESRYANGIRYTIEVCNTINSTNSYLINAPANQTIKSGYIDRNDFDERDTTFTLNVSGNSIIFFRLQSNGNRTFDNVVWNKEIEYIGSSAQGNNEDDYYNSNNDYLVTGKHYFVAPEDGYVEYTLDIQTGYLYGQTCTLEVRVNNYTPSYSQILYNGMNTVVFNQANLVAGDSIKIKIKGNEPKDAPVWANIVVKPIFKYFSNGPEITESLNYYPGVNYEQVHQIGTNRLDTVFYGLFGPLYRGWGQFCYNNNYTNGSITDPIEPATLRKVFTFLSEPQSDFEDDIYATPDTVNFDQNTVTANYTAQGKYAPLSVQTRWVEVLPYSYQQVWGGLGNINYICKDTMSNGRFKTINPDIEVANIEAFDNPVPITSNPAQVKTIRKQVYSKNSSKGYNAGFIVTVGGSYSKGGSYTLTDYIDMNGDRYPDILGDVYVQYSNPWGGIGAKTPLHKSVQGISHDTSDSWGVSFGATYPIVKKEVTYKPNNAKGTIECSGNSSASYSNSTNKSYDNYIDVNGDGLPDKVDEQGNVALNLGYSFLPKVSYNYNTVNYSPVRKGQSNSFGLSAGASLAATFDVSQGSISGGTGMSYSNNFTDRTLIDFNGDGNVDIVYRIGNKLYAIYRLSNGTFTQPEYIGEYYISYGVTSGESANIGVNVGFTWGWAKFGVGIQGTPYGKSFSKDSVQLVDINGDGYLDYISSKDETSIDVRYNQSGQTNLLKKVTNFTGSSFEIEYELSIPSYNSPQRTWLLKSVKTSDPYSPIGGKTTYTTFEYRNPYYNRYERISYGYDTVITYQHNPESYNATYRKTIQGFNNKSFIKKGKKTSETVCDANDKVYVETFYDVTIIDASGNAVNDNECPDLYFPSRICEVTNYYEGMTTPQITTKKCVMYDPRKNVTEYINSVDSSNNVVTDFLKAKISYKKNMPNNMISLVDTMIVTDYSNNEIRKKTAEYSVNGKLQKINQFNGSDVATIDLEYDQYGNINKIIYPENINSQRMWFQYVYDPVVHTFPITVTSALGFQSSAQYDYKWGKPTSTIDINGQEMRYEYDNLGRTITITGPNEIANNALYTIKMEYFPVNYYRWNIFTPSIDTFSYAITSHYDVQHPTNPIKTTILCDGLGRVIQSKKDIEIDGVEKSTVSGKIVVDAFGRTIKQYQPVTESTTNAKKYNYSFVSNTLKTTQFDILDRELKVTLPNNAITNMQYTFGNDAFGIKRFLTIAIDPNGNKVKTYTDPRKLKTTIIADSTNVTKFVYNAMGELLESTDPDGEVTYYSYNNFGQKISRIHPDAGTDLFTYDMAGNLINRQTQDLINSNMNIIYDYNYNQMTAIHYPKNPENDVYYYYGDNNALNNRKGKVWAIEDASGRQEISYGKMGEVIENIRTFALPNEQNTYTFKMLFSYDSWNRILNTVYPDGENVAYSYNYGGLLKSMSSYYGSSYSYINEIKYNQFEKRTYIEYGNGAYSEYTYDVLQRLTRLKSTSSSGIMQSIDYTFDNVNNITSIENGATELSNGLGGTYQHEYSYDNLYRISSSSGSWANNNDNLTYNLDMTYSKDGRILTKSQAANTLINGSLSSFSYQNSYSYNSYQPHTVYNVNDMNMDQNFNWDANGNLIYHNIQSEENRLSRTLCWDEENRLMSVGDNNYVSYYVYDNSGERTYKLTGPNQYMNINGTWMNYATLYNPTLYTSPYLVANSQGYSKHYYAGSERIASSIGKGGLTNISFPLQITSSTNWSTKSSELLDEMNRTIEDCISIAYTPKRNLLNNLYNLSTLGTGIMDRYFYHPDHLGSSSWITDKYGNATQHLHYLPFGEDWVDQRNSSWTAPYTFSGKEKDVETGYGYFGARYYDSGLNIWLSVDPMSDKYPSMSPYNYCANNPVMLKDPDGKEIWILYDGNRYQYSNGRLYLNGAECTSTSTLPSFVKTTYNLLNRLKSNPVAMIIMPTLEKSVTEGGKAINISYTSGEPGTNPNSTDFYNGFTEVNVRLNYNYLEIPTLLGMRRDNIATIYHELSHAYSMVKNEVMEGSHDNLPLSEWKAVFEENKLRANLRIPLRTYYKVYVSDGRAVGGAPPRMLDDDNNPIDPETLEPQP